MPTNKKKENWLPEDYTLKLNALELGYISASVFMSKLGQPDGLTKPLPFVVNLQKKINKEIDKVYGSKQHK